MKKKINNKWHIPFLVPSSLGFQRFIDFVSCIWWPSGGPLVFYMLLVAPDKIIKKGAEEKVKLVMKKQW